MTHKNILFAVMAGVSFFIPAISFAYTINSTGGDCALFGTWDGSTCTMTQDIEDSIIINSDNITLDGAGHILSTTTPIYVSPTNGITLSSRTGIVVKNITIFGFTCGIKITSSSHITAKENIFRDGGYGIHADGNADNPSAFIFIRKNRFERNDEAISLQNTEDVTIEDNIVTNV
ncbi:MAG: NosD domain-containing protein, partial [Candidatus Paceibacterota bacterium]